MKNIYTGEDAKNIFEVYGYKEFDIPHKKIKVNYNAKEYMFDFVTNTEFEVFGLKFVLCSTNGNNYDIWFNTENIADDGYDRIRSMLVFNGKTYYSNGYNIDIEKEFEININNCKLVIYFDNVAQ